MRVEIWQLIIGGITALGLGKVLDNLVSKWLNKDKDEIEKSLSDFTIMEKINKFKDAELDKMIDFVDKLKTREEEREAQFEEMVIADRKKALHLEELKKDNEILRKDHAKLKAHINRTELFLKKHNLQLPND